MIKFKQWGHIWLFNCFEGCQHVLAGKNIKIAQIKKIIIPYCTISNLTGLLGLLSTISLSTLNHRIDIYGPRYLYRYVFWGRKYSKTNFRYRLYFYNISDGMMVWQLNASMNAFVSRYKVKYADYSFVNAEQAGPFNSDNANKYNVPLGPLYSQFKTGQNFILPDGSVLCSYKFVQGYYLGSQFVLVDFFSRKLEAITAPSTVCIIRY